MDSTISDKVYNKIKGIRETIDSIDYLNSVGYIGEEEFKQLKVLASNLEKFLYKLYGKDKKD